MRTLISILAGIVTHILLFTYLSGRTTCAVTIQVERSPQPGDCFVRFWDNLRITYPGGLPVTDTWGQVLSPPFLIPAVAGLLMGVILWAAWARKQRPRPSA